MHNFMSVRTFSNCISYVIYLYIVCIENTHRRRAIIMSLYISQEEVAPVPEGVGAGLLLHDKEINAEEELEEQKDEQHFLVTRALQGDQKAFGEIVGQYSTLMLRTASMIAG